MTAGAVVSVGASVLVGPVLSGAVVLEDLVPSSGFSVGFSRVSECAGGVILLNDVSRGKSSAVTYFS